MFDGNSEITFMFRVKSAIWSDDGICVDRQQSQFFFSFHTNASSELPSIINITEKYVHFCLLEPDHFYKGWFQAALGRLRIRNPVFG